MLYTEADLEKSMDRIETINFHEEKDVGGIRFCAYNAGHVLGAAMFMIEIAGVKVLYTGDFSRQEDRHLMAAEIPPSRPEILITVIVVVIVVFKYKFTNLKLFVLSRNLPMELIYMKNVKNENDGLLCLWMILSIEVEDVWFQFLH